MDILLSLIFGFLLGSLFMSKFVSNEDLENKTTVLYLCDSKKCYEPESCKDRTECNHTMDIRHAKNFVQLRPNVYVEKEKTDE